MSRHRNVRSMNFNEEDDGYDDVYGHSIEDDYCISPGTASQFMYNRGEHGQNISSFLHREEDSMAEIPEEEEVAAVLPMEEPELQFCDPQLDKIKLDSCVEEMHNIVGDTVPESHLIAIAKKHNCNYERALNDILTNPTKFTEIKPKENKNAHSTNIVAPKAQIFNISKEKIPSEVDKMLKEVTSVEKGLLNDISNITSETENIILVEKKEMPAMLDEMVIPKSNKAAKSSTELLAEYNKVRGSDKPLLNLVVIGHVDAGKSTLMGHMLFKMGHVSKKLMHKYKQESQKIGKSSFVYAWVLDETEEERNRGITTDVAQTRLETSKRSINLLDAPGHKDFIPHMITGASQADVAVLVVDSTKGEFETGFEAGGQTREHTLLVRSLGVFQLAVAVNKMDNVDWAKDRFDDIVRRLSSFLKQVGFKESDVTFVPCSGLQGENLNEASRVPELVSWYSGPCLLDVIDNFKTPERLVTKPFRFCLNDVFKGMGSGICVAGKVEAGSVQAGDKLLLMPGGEATVAKNILIDEMPMTQAFAGDYITLTLSGVDQNILNPGCVLCDPAAPIRATTRIQARIVIFNVDIPLTRGFEVILHYQNVSEQAYVHKILSQLHKSTGEVVKKKPRFLPKNSSGIVELDVPRPICVELYKDFKDLGRVMLRSGGATIAAGLITKIL